MGTGATRERSSGQQAHRDYWFRQYLAMGAGRSLRKLLAAAQADNGQNGGRKWEYPCPSITTLEKWSSADGWDRRAKQFDAEQHEAEEQRLREEMRQDFANRRNSRLLMASEFRQIAVSILMGQFVVTRPDGTKEVETRRLTYQEIGHDGVTDLIRLHKTAEFTERIEAGEETSRNAGMAEGSGNALEGADRQVIIQILGREALADIEQYIMGDEEPPRARRALEGPTAPDPQPIIEGDATRVVQDDELGPIEL